MNDPDNGMRLICETGPEIENATYEWYRSRNNDIGPFRERGAPSGDSSVGIGLFGFDPNSAHIR